MSLSWQTGYNLAFRSMKHDLAVRVIVERPLSGVTMQVQRGRCELLPPSKDTAAEKVFEFKLKVDLTGSEPNFLGEYAQGPRDARFVYVNTGTYAGDARSEWGRRAKLPLGSVTSEQVESVLADPRLLLETSFAGTGRDGTPTCATVKGLEWKVVKR